MKDMCGIEGGMAVERDFALSGLKTMRTGFYSQGVALRYHICPRWGRARAVA